MISGFTSNRILLLLAIALTCLSAAYQRVGPRRMVTGEAWCSAPAPCAIPALGAGFPLPYLVDNPQISVPNAVGLFEDDFCAAAFLADALFWFVLAATALCGAQIKLASADPAIPRVPARRPKQSWLGKQKAQ